jgi:Ca2+-binding RTX toxin-like protein
MPEQFGGPGNDVLIGTPGEDGLYGFGGDDILDGAGGDDWLQGGAGADQIIGGAGLLDYAAYKSAPEGVLVDLATPSLNTGDAAGDSYGGIEGLVGSLFSDSLRGDNGDNYLFGLDGSDSLYGRDGVDTLVGGDGDDYLTGGAGGDYLIGGAGLDQVLYTFATAGLTVDLLHPWAFNTGEAAGDNYDSIEGLAGSAFNDTLSGNLVDNYVWGGDGNDTLFGRAGNDTLVGGAGNDFLEGGEGRDLLVGGDGFDFAMYTTATAGVRAFLSFPFGTGEAFGDSFFSIEGLWGSDFDDNLSGNEGDNSLVGGAGNDFLFGAGGADVVQGGAGDDNVGGGDGNDMLGGGAGNDTINGGPGRDTYIFGVGDGIDRIGDMSTDLGFGATPIDQIQLSTALGVTSFADVQARAQQVGNSTVITFDANTVLELTNVHSLSLSASNFLFV